ncbi:hypothetical protein H634G_00657 [Metarhizium anisopliae BRIP 53293]|uniref:Uncharacterized protein n=1 Tax=Metarhizium anisopliae BRIP 53293 TaxID=1291518 RepID=A0A0D9PDU7_METAN|nr:hypothetical protein H634G_00657 [Metarhizium anisopliae BRIP 53293]KJK94497.1 hypothetical protein H633G_01580 [Metarhizium anisopliae BRIP 53284]
MNIANPLLTKTLPIGCSGVGIRAFPMNLLSPIWKPYCPSFVADLPLLHVFGQEEVETDVKTVVLSNSVIERWTYGRG